MAENREPLSPLWELAIAEYEAETNRKPLSAVNTLRGIKTPEELLAQIENSGQMFEEFRSRRSRLWNTVELFVSPISTLLNIAITPSSVSDGFGIPASAVIGACLYLVKSCENVSKAYDWIEQVFTELQEFSERLKVYAESRIDAVLKKKMVAILAFSLRVIGRSETLIRNGRFVSYLRVTFLGKDEKTKKLVDDLNKLFGSEQRFVLAVTYATVQRIEDKFEMVDGKVEQIAEGMRKVHVMMDKAQELETSAQIADRLQRVLYDTSAVDDVQDSYLLKKLELIEGTSKAWLQEEPIFTSWIERRATILWIFGGPGAGKSYLSTWIVKQLLEDLPEAQRSATSVAYFFVKENNQMLRDANVMLKTLAWQLIGQDSQFKEHAAEICKQRALTITAEETWKNLFLGYYGRSEANPRFASILIDGLDEATSSTRRTLLGLMKGLISASGSAHRPAIQFAVVGRTTLREDMDFTREEKVYLIEVSETKNRKDMDRYIRSRLPEIQLLKEMKPKLAKKTRKDIRVKVLLTADGVFLWAKLLLDSILRKDLQQIEAILRDPPTGVYNMIASVFDRLAKDEEMDHGVLKRMLMLMAYAQRPLKFGELDLFLSLPSRKPNYLLWRQTRGKLSSVFDLKFPKDYTPDEVKEGDAPEVNVDEEWSSDSSENGDDSDEDDLEDVLGGGDQNSTYVDGNGRKSKRWSLQRETTEELTNHLSDGQLKTEVTFCHALIREYIVGEANAQKLTEPHCALIPDLDSVHAEYTIACLDVLRLEISLKQESRYLADYPMRYLAVHLDKVDRRRSSDEQFWRIVNGLYWLFGTEIGAECLVKANQDYDSFHSSEDAFFQTWVGTDRYIRLLQAWCGDVELRGGGQLQGVDAAARAWMKNSASSFELLLQPAMTAISRMWLVKPSFDSTEYLNKGQFFVWILHGWSFLSEQGSVDPMMQDIEITKHWDNFRILSPERLEHMASLAGLEKDTHWHTCLGWILMEGKFYVEAVAHYQEALALCGQAWVALEGLARCYGEQEDYKLAIDYQQKALDALPKSFTWIPAYLYPRIVDWSLQIGNEELAYEAARSGFKADRANGAATIKYLEALHRRGESQTIMDTIESLHGIYNIGEDWSWFQNVLLNCCDAFDEIGKACRELGQPQWVLEAMDDSLRRVDLNDRTWAKLWLSFKMTTFRSKWYDNEEEETIRMAESSLAMLKQQAPELQAQFSEDQQSTTNTLAILLFDKSVSLWNDGQGAANASVFADKLKALAVSVETNFGDGYEGFDFYRKDYPALLWGRWLKDYRKAEDRVWKKVFKVRILEQLNSLDDDDPANDEDGMDSVAVSLFHAGNRRDAAAILAIMFKGLEDSKAKRIQDGVQEESAAPSALDAIASEGAPITPRAEGGEDVFTLQGNDAAHLATPTRPKQASRGLSLHVGERSYGYGCNNCERDASEADEIYFCEVCIDTHWCGDCLRKMRDPSIVPGLAERACNPKHDAYRAWPIPDGARDLAAEYMEGGIELRREWLEGLRGEWLKAGV